MKQKSTSKTFKFQRGDVYLIEEHPAQGNEQRKTRPWVLVGASPINTARSTILAVPLSTQTPEKPPLSIKVYFNNSNACAVLDQLRALDKKRFIQLEGAFSTYDMTLIDDGLRQVLAL